MNKQASIEWLTKSWHHFSSGKLLYEANHYTDVIAIDLHYAIEVMLKAFIAYENKKMIKTHDLIDITNNIKNWIEFDMEEKKLLVIVSTYHIKGSYPAFDRKMPSRDEIKQVIDFATELFDRICDILDIDTKEIKCQKEN